MKIKFKENNYSGKLIAVEGISRAGKTTFINTFLKLYPQITYVKWNSSDELSGIISDLKTKKMDSLSWCLIHLLDYNLTYQKYVLPSLKEGKIVISDRYIYTSVVRDIIRNIDKKIILSIAKNFIKPDLTFYFQITPELSLYRHKECELRINRKIEYCHYASGNDIFVNVPVEESYLKYQELLLKEYRKLIKINNFVIKDHEIILKQFIKSHQ